MIHGKWDEDFAGLVRGYEGEPINEIECPNCNSTSWQKHKFPNTKAYFVCFRCGFEFVMSKKTKKSPLRLYSVVR